MYNKFSQVSAGAGTEQQDNACTTAKKSSWKSSSPQKAGLLLSFSLYLMVPSLPTGKHHKTNRRQINFASIYHRYRVIRILLQG